MSRIPVAILGATGTVGQILVQRLASHPWFEPVALVASERSAGQRYGDVVRWRAPGEIPSRLANLPVLTAVPDAVPYAFSALDAALAREIEPALAARGITVLSNASAHRLEPDVPLVIPEVNPGHLALLDIQRARRGWSGALSANPNCVVAALAVALAPLHRAFTLERLVVTTMQAASGAGYPGVPSLDLLGNVIPWIDGEEAKIGQELNRLLGAYDGEQVRPAGIGVSAHTNRVPTVDGHLVTVSAGFRTHPGADDLREVLREWRPEAPICDLPSTPATPVVLHERADRPQPRLDVHLGNGMSVSVGRIRPCPVLDVRFVVLGHNLVRGAAGAAIQLGELVASSFPPSRG